MKHRFLVLAACAAMCLIPWLVPGNAADDGSCVKCHTDAQMLKSLAKAPTVLGGEGEG